MNKKEIITVREKMQSHLKSFYDVTVTTVRCPSIEKMSEYLKAVHPKLDVDLVTESHTKHTQSDLFRSTVTGGTKNYVGHRLIVKDNDKTIIDHNATETYRQNIEVAEIIMDLEGFDVLSS